MRRAVYIATLVGALLLGFASTTRGQIIYREAFGLVQQGTLTADGQAISTTATWNNAAVTFTHWLANVTDTASGSLSKLLDLQVAGVSKFSVRKDGRVTAADFVGTALFFGSTLNQFKSTGSGNARITDPNGTNTFDLTLSDWGTTLSAEGVSVANNGVIALMAGSYVGQCVVTTGTDDRPALVEFLGTNNSVGILTNSGSIYSAVAGTASKINLYHDAAGPSGAGYYLQNTRGGTRTVRLQCLGG